MKTYCLLPLCWKPFIMVAHIINQPPRGLSMDNGCHEFVRTKTTYESLTFNLEMETYSTPAFENAQILRFFSFLYVLHSHHHVAL